MRGGVKYLNCLKSENNSKFIICRLIVPSTLCMQTAIFYPPPPALYCANIWLKFVSKVTKNLTKNLVCSQILYIANLSEWRIMLTY